MGAVPALRGARERVAAVHRELDGVLAEIAALGDGPGVAVEELRALDDEVFRARNRLEAVRLRIAGLARREREAGRSHHLDEGQFVGRGGRLDGPTAARAGRLAEELGSGVLAPGEPGQECTAEALDAGTITPEHARSVAQALRDLPEWVTAEDRRRVERHLVEKATRLSPRSVREEGRRCLAALPVPPEVVDAHEDELLSGQERAAHEAASFTIHHGPDGVSHGRFSVPTLQGRLLEKVLASLSGPRRRVRPGAGAEGRGRQGAPGQGVDGAPVADPPRDRAPENARDRAAERGQALAELIDHLPTDHFGGRTAYTVIVSTDLATLRGETDRAGLTDVGEKVSAGQVRRIAAQAGIVPTVMGGESLPLDLGTQRRFFTESQRMALAHLYARCAAEDCDRPFAWTEMHHVDGWSGRRGDGPAGTGRTGAGRGRTDLANAIPLCGRHNRMVEDPLVEHVVTRDAEGRATVRLRRRPPGPPPGRRGDGGVSPEWTA